MPGYDGTGPNGQGPMTGRGMGYCTGAPGAGYGRGFGRGFGWFGRGFGGFGMRRGFRGGGRFWAVNNPPQYMHPDAERIDELESRIAEFQDELASLRQRNADRDNQR